MTEIGRRDELLLAKIGDEVPDLPEHPRNLFACPRLTKKATWRRSFSTSPLTLWQTASKKGRGPNLTAFFASNAYSQSIAAIWPRCFG